MVPVPKVNIRNLYLMICCKVSMTCAYIRVQTEEMKVMSTQSAKCKAALRIYMLDKYRIDI